MVRNDAATAYSAPEGDAAEGRNRSARRGCCNERAEPGGGAQKEYAITALLYAGAAFVALFPRNSTRNLK
jgi:hypothetical protein